MARYKQLLFFATKLETLPDEDHVPENKVKGCVSQVWVVPTLKPEDGNIYWKADSDSQLTKGLAALLVQGLSGLTPEEIVKVQPDFIASLGLAQALTPSRNNGFLNMFKLMQAKALELLLQQKQQEIDKNNSSDGYGSRSGSNAQDQTTTTAAAAAGAGAAQPSTNESTLSSSSPTSSNTPVADKVKEKLQEQLQPAKLNILDDSSKHAGHGGYKGTANYSGETHFTIEVVSAAFEGLSSVKRHRLVYGILDEEMGAPIHALSLVTKTPGEAGM
jgi:BolA-like protein 1